MPLVNFNHAVAHITQQDQNYCWACALAMILGRHSWAAALQLADRCPSSARNVSTGALLDPAAAARALHLNAARVTSFSPADLSQRMGRGAVAVFGRYNTGAGTFSHVMVVSLLRGNLDDTATLTVGVDDPLANGTRWTGAWNRWVGPGLTLRSAEWLVSR